MHGPFRQFSWAFSCCCRANWSWTAAGSEEGFRGAAGQVTLQVHVVVTFGRQGWLGSRAVACGVPRFFF